MTTRIPTLLLAGLLVAACADASRQEDAEPAAEQATSDAAVEAALEQIRADYVSHYNQHHPDIVAALFTDSAFGLWADGLVSTGRAEILASLQEDMAASPTLDIQTDETMVFGDHAVARGRYTVTLAPAGAEPVTVSGSYMTVFESANGDWKIDGLISNFDAEPPDGVVQPQEPDDEPPPPDAGTMREVVDAYTTHMAAADWAALARLYTDNAVAAFSNAPPVQGHSAIQTRFGEVFGETPVTIEIHDVGTLELEGGWALDGGWYMLEAATPEGSSTQGGTYLNLLRREPDGSWKIHWAVSNGQPVPAS